MFSVGYLPFCIGSVFEGSQAAQIAFLPSTVTDNQIEDRLNLGHKIDDILLDLAMGPGVLRQCSVPAFGESWADVTMSANSAYVSNLKQGSKYTYDYTSFLNAGALQTGPGERVSFVGHTYKRAFVKGYTATGTSSPTEVVARQNVLVDPTSLPFKPYGSSYPHAVAPEEAAVTNVVLLQGSSSSGQPRTFINALHLDLGATKRIDRVALSISRTTLIPNSASYIKVVAWTGTAWVDLATINSANIIDANQRYAFSVAPVQARYIAIFGYGSMPSSYPSPDSHVLLHMCAVGDSTEVDSADAIDRAIVLVSRNKNDLTNVNISNKPSYAILTVGESGSNAEIVVQSKNLTGNKIPSIVSASLNFGVKP